RPRSPLSTPTFAAPIGSRSVAASVINLAMTAKNYGTTGRAKVPSTKRARWRCSGAVSLIATAITIPSPRYSILLIRLTPIRTDLQAAATSRRRDLLDVVSRTPQSRRPRPFHAHEHKPPPSIASQGFLSNFSKVEAGTGPARSVLWVGLWVQMEQFSRWRRI